MPIRAPKDFWTGVMFIAFAAVAMAVARDYSLGTAVRMGPGYFPLVLGSVLAVLGAILIVKSLFVTGEPVGQLHLRPLGIIVLSVVLFGLALPRLGLVAALAIVVALSACASREAKPFEVAALAAVLCAFSVAVFVYGLRLPLPVWPAL